MLDASFEPLMYSLPTGILLCNSSPTKKLTSLLPGLRFSPISRTEDWKTQGEQEQAFNSSLADLVAHTPLPKANILF